ncbi:carbamoyl-phosphate synthase L chain, ATP binding domain-containing protein [Umbelopsis sp. PMI_123]|nr:carbamoyl-phosphate synthase L chain, ATP binding domain-containing protein [Umbelopsis sp. PMI_123]
MTVQNGNVKLLVANRGEIAIRILNCARELGHETVAVFSDPADMSHTRFAETKVQLQGGPLSFLKPKALIDAAKQCGATAIHPGYGFLSESAEFASLCADNGILFVGPSATSIRQVGDKLSARQTALDAKIPVAPGTKEPVHSPEEVRQFAKHYGYPIMLKARDGGGGRGIRMVHKPDEVESVLQRCINESPSKQVFIEKAIIGAKHIEIQILGDKHGSVVHLKDRDCSVQRRFQKIIEIAPSVGISPSLRARIQQSALSLAQHIRYDSAGTVEFLVTPADQQYYFLEVNPRIQVEHTISDEITGIDIVRSQILVALGESLQGLGISQSRIDNVPPMVSIQARICAEDPHKENMLSVGKVIDVEFPMGQGVRVDTWIHPGAVVLPHFDSLLAKVIVTAETFPLAIQKLKRALHYTIIEGVKTNRDFLLVLLQDDQFLNNDTRDVNVLFLEARIPHLLDASRQLIGDDKRRTCNGSADQNTVAPPGSIQFKSGDVFNIELASMDKSVPKQVHSIKMQDISSNDFPDNFNSTIEVASSSTSSLGSKLQLKLSRRSAAADSTLRRKAIGAPGEMACPVSGMITEISVKVGDKIEAGQEAFVVSAMKMETVIKASINGRVKAIYAKANELVDAGDLIIDIAEQKDSKL